MTVRRRRLSGLAPVAALLLLALAFGRGVWCQDAPDAPKSEAAPKAEEPSPRSSSPTSGPAAPTPAPAPFATVQTGLPPEMVIDLKHLDDHEKALESALVYIRSSRPSGNFISKIGRSISGLFSGQKKPRSTTLEAISAPGGQWNGKLVAVEGLVRTDKSGKLSLVAGKYRLPLTQLPHTIVQGFPGKPQGMPARAEGIVIVGQEGPDLNANQIAPAPILTAVRLARCHELRQTAAGYQQAVDLYDEAATGGTAEPWLGFATAHGGKIAAEVLRNAKEAIKLYNRAWDLEGRTKSAHSPLPVTWLQDAENGEWTSETLRAVVAKPLDALNSQGFWYKFVDAFVTICGGNAGVGLVLLAIGTRLLLYPLTRKQIRSARDMQKLQPQIKALQEKHGSDKQKFNEEFWRLCKENGVNPLGGCLPLLIQMPLLIMVYRGIRAYVVQLAAHHFLWIHSLADPDMPLLILYTVSMIAFQKLTMKTQPMADPQQQQQQNMMVWMMPLMFFMFFQGLPSGFILYWLGTNLIYLPQQYFGTRLKKEEQGGERTVTLETRSSSNPTEPQGPLAWLQGLVGAKPKEPEEAPPPSYEEKKTAEKRKQRRPTRRRRRP